MKKKIIVSAIVILALLNAFQFSWDHFAYQLFTDAVPTEEVALEVGKSVLAGAYGEEVLNMEFAVLEYNNNSWIVYGDPGGIGGVPEIIIRKNDGKILKIQFTS